MSSSKDKYEEINSQSYSGIGEFCQTTTQDKFDPIDEYFEKNNETLMRDLVEEIKIWNEDWFEYYEHGTTKPLNADLFSEELSKKYEIKLK